MPLQSQYLLGEDACGANVWPTWGWLAVGGTGICVRQGARCKRTASSTTGCSSTIRNLWQPVVILVSHYIFLNSTLTLTLLSLSLTLP